MFHNYSFTHNIQGGLVYIVGILLIDSLLKNKGSLKNSCL